MAPRSSRASTALSYLPERDPALAALALWCVMRDDPGPTRTSGDTILIGPDFPALPLREQVGLIGHHILHVVLRHAGRLTALRQRLGGQLHPRSYNLASDAIVNECLLAAGHALPRPAVTLSEVLTQVLQQPTDAALAEWDAERLYMALLAQDEDGRARETAYGRKTAFHEDLESDNATGQDRDRGDWQAHLARALATAGASGRGIGSVLSQLLDLPKVTTPWELHLRRLLARATTEVPRLSYRRPRRSWVAAEAAARDRDGPVPVFEPGFSRNQRRPRIAVGLDTSGSVSPTVLSLFAAEIAGIARRSGAELQVLSFDETVYDSHQLPPGDLSSFLQSVSFRRDGGTDFADLLERSQALDPSILVVLTDLLGGFGPSPACPVLWATPTTTWPEPPFGTVLSLAN